MKDTIIIHCSATRAGQDITAADIDCWHRARGFWSIGYHYVIRLDGTMNRDETSPSTGRIVWAGTSVPSASATSADWTRKAAPPTHGQMHNALPSSDW